MTKLRSSLSFFQILLDVVSIFNIVSSLSRKEQSVKLTQEGIEVGFAAPYIGKFFGNMLLLLPFDSKLFSSVSPSPFLFLWIIGAGF